MSLKILYTSDIHASNTHLFSMLSIAEKEEVDGIIIGGDIIPHSLPQIVGVGQLEAQTMYLENVFVPTIADFKEKTGTTMYLDLGNDDFIYGRKVLEEYNGELFNLIHLSKHRLTDDVDIIGYMNVPPTPFGAKDLERPDSTECPFTLGNDITLKGYISANGILEEVVLNLASEDTIENDLNRLSTIIEKPFLFISHSPPYNTPLDMIYNGNHVGSISIRKFIEEWSRKGLLIAAFHGHIHESPIRSGSIQTRIGNASCINPGQGNGEGAEFRYIIFELSGTRILYSTHQITARMP